MSLIFRKVEMETKRKLGEMERKRQEDEDLRAAVALQVRFEIVRPFIGDSSKIKCVFIIGTAREGS